MGDLWNDVRLAGILFVFVYLVQWGIGTTGSRKVGIILAIIIIFLTIYQHFEVLVVVIMFFFGYAFFEKFEATWK